MSKSSVSWGFSFNYNFFQSKIITPSDSSDWSGQAAAHFWDRDAAGQRWKNQNPDAFQYDSICPEYSNPRAWKKWRGGVAERNSVGWVDEDMASWLFLGQLKRVDAFNVKVPSLMIGATFWLPKVIIVKVWMGHHLKFMTSFMWLRLLDAAVQLYATSEMVNSYWSAGTSTIGTVDIHVLYYVPIVWRCLKWRISSAN